MGFNSGFKGLIHERHDFRNKVIEHKTCVLISCANCGWNISHSKENSARYCHECRVRRSSCKVPVFLVRF